jgi:hypothetical protein
MGAITKAGIFDNQQSLDKNLAKMSFFDNQGG